MADANSLEKKAPLSLQIMANASSSEKKASLSLQIMVDIASSVGRKASPSSSSQPSIADLNLNCDSDGFDDELIILNGHNFERSKVPVRILFYCENCWVDFKAEVVESLRSGFLEGKWVLPLEIDGSKYAIDFVRMVQVDLESGNQWSIAWFDESGKRFFPSRFLDGAFSHEVI